MIEHIFLANEVTIEVCQVIVTNVCEYVFSISSTDLVNILNAIVLKSSRRLAEVNQVRGAWVFHSNLPCLKTDINNYMDKVMLANIVS